MCDAALSVVNVDIFYLDNIIVMIHRELTQPSHWRWANK